MSISALDPVMLIALHLFLAAIFSLSCLHKLKNFTLFKQHVADYRVLPEALTGAAAIVLTLLEICLVVLLLTQSSFGLLLAAALLLLYAFVMWVNLVKGRDSIDCGCGDPDQGQTISYSLVLRNAILAGLALAGVFATVTSRELAGFDFATILFAVIAALLMYTTINQLLANLPRLRNLG